MCTDTEYIMYGRTRNAMLPETSQRKVISDYRLRICSNLFRELVLTRHRQRHERVEQVGIEDAFCEGLRKVVVPHKSGRDQYALPRTEGSDGTGMHEG
jgi:hypothetical protein